MAKSGDRIPASHQEDERSTLEFRPLHCDFAAEVTGIVPFAAAGYTRLMRRTILEGDALVMA